MTIFRGCDVSTFQAPTLVPWKNYDFGIVRATYGTTRDKKTVLHASKIREAEKVLGLYHFFLPHQNVDAQLEAFSEVAKAVGLHEGDLMPCVDIEAYPDKFSGSKATHWADVSPFWETPLLNLVMGLERLYGGCICYITQRDWSLLGKPNWVLERPLWVAHYPKTGATSPLAKPATPGNRPYAIWQCMVGPLGKALQSPADAAAVDQNLAVGPLPLIRAETPDDLEITVTQSDIPIDPATVPYVHLTDEDWDEMRAARDLSCREI